MMDCPIIAQPPIPPKKPVTIFAPPCAIHSRLEFPRVSVKSSTKLRVIKDSINPIAARIPAYGRINKKVSKFIGILEKVSNTGTGNPPFKPSPPPSLIKDPTVATSRLEKITIPATTKIAINASGNFFVAFIFGNPHIINIVSPTRPIIIYRL